MDLYAVIGRPILHSRSPELHNAAFRGLGVHAIYVRLASREASDALESARRMGIKGLNVTAPYKETVSLLSNDHDPITRTLQAANTLLWREGSWRARNTDVAGVLGALARHQVELAGANAVVLGSGGAALAAAMALRQGGALVTVAARNLAGAQRVADQIGCAFRALTDTSDVVRQARVLVSAVSTDEPVVAPEALHPALVVLDARYQTESALVREAGSRGCVVIDGREWLLCQAAEAFELFSSRKAPMAAMRESLEQAPPERGASIALTGFMGAGKSSVARMLGPRLGLPVVDTDSLVERAAGIPVDRLLRDRGEQVLRDYEARVLESLPDDPCVVACGGGLITEPRSAALLRGRSRLVVWLWASTRTCLERIGDTSTRPLLGRCPETTAQRLLQRRTGSYAAACDVVVDTESRSVTEVASLTEDLWREPA